MRRLPARMDSLVGDGVQRVQQRSGERGGVTPHLDASLALHHRVSLRARHHQRCIQIILFD